MAAKQKTDGVKASTAAPTVENLIYLLKHALTQYDIKASKGRFYSPYALGHYMIAADKVAAKCKAVLAKSDAASIAKFRAALNECFTREGYGPNAKFSISAVTKIDQMAGGAK